MLRQTRTDVCGDDQFRLVALFRTLPSLFCRSDSPPAAFLALKIGDFQPSFNWVLSRLFRRQSVKTVTLVFSDESERRESSAILRSHYRAYDVFSAHPTSTNAPNEWPRRRWSSRRAVIKIWNAGIGMKTAKKKQWLAHRDAKKAFGKAAPRDNDIAVYRSFFYSLSKERITERFECDVSHRETLFSSLRKIQRWPVRVFFTCFMICARQLFHRTRS